MFGFLNKIRKKRLNYEQLQILQFLAQQVVLSVEGSVRLPGSGKKALAIELMGQLLEELELVAPESLLDALIESSVSILRVLEPTKEAITPKTRLDLSGQPPTGNSL
jgi:hypothetical protein